MNSSDKLDTQAALDATPVGLEPGAVLAREAGLPYHASIACAHGADPFAEWLSLMDVVHMLCPVWPVRDKPMQGSHWLL